MNKENNENLDELALRLHAIIETAIDGIITIDIHGIVETMNTAAGKLFGYHPTEMIGKNVSVLMPTPYQKEHDGYLERYHQTREARIIGIGREVRGLKKDGTVFPLRLAVSETRLGDRMIYTGIIHDMTDVKFAEKEVLRLNDMLSQQNESLEKTVTERTESLGNVVNELLNTKKQLENALARERETSELKSRFLSTASHEFRTPLASILSSAEILDLYAKGKNDLKFDKHVGRIRSSVQQLNGILIDFLSLSRLEEGKVPVQLVEFLVEPFCHDVIDELRGLFKTGQMVHFAVEGPARPIFSDKKILKNILFNLLSNASKYSAEGQPIDCHCIFENESLLIAVRDRGIGIPKKDQTHLFENFFRASNAENIQGTGLGLAIVKRYAELLRGSVFWESEEGVGTEFFVKIPI